MYDPHAVLQRISDHPVPVLLFGGIAIVANLVYYTEMYRAAARDVCMPMTLVAIAAFIPHDGLYVLDAHKWFSTYNHWFPILFWFALIVTCVFAFAFLRQIVLYGRREIGLRLSQRSWTALCGAAVVLGAVLWGVLKDNLDDDLFLLSFMITIAWAGLSGVTLLVRRGSARGQTQRQWIAFTVMGTSFFVCSQWLGHGFHGVGWYALSAAAVAPGVFMWTAVSHTQRAGEDVLEGLAGPAVQAEEARVGVRG